MQYSMAVIEVESSLCSRFFIKYSFLYPYRLITSSLSQNKPSLKVLWDVQDQWRIII